jgi:hypothetical protein
MDRVKRKILLYVLPRDCLGRRCIGFMNRHMFTPQTKECLMSAALCSLPCALHINISNFSQYDAKTLRFDQATVNSPSDPRWLSELLYEAFKESRRLVKAIETALYFYSGINIGFIAPCLLLVCVLCTPPFFRVRKHILQDKTYLNMSIFTDNNNTFH